MTDPEELEILERASLYALGALTAAEREAVDAELRSSIPMRRAVRDFAEVGGLLGELANGPTPSPSLRARMLERLERTPFHFTRANDGAWRTVTHGVSEKRLHDAPDSCRLLRLEHGAIHRVAEQSPEQWLIVSGAIHVGSQMLHRGDYHQEATAATARSTTESSVVLVFPRIVPAQAMTLTIRAEEGAWTPLAEGISCKSLGVSSDNLTHFNLVRMAPGSVVDDHDHGGAEELFLIEGECRFAGRDLGAGDYHRAADHSHHGRTTTMDGCVMVYINRAA